MEYDVETSSLLLDTARDLTMARYATDQTIHFSTFSIRREEHEIHINKVSAIAFHREIQDLFDQTDWMTESSPSAYGRMIGHNIIHIHAPWKVVNPKDVTAGEIRHNYD